MIQSMRRALIVFLLITVVRASAQSSRNSAPMYYDIAQEATLSGTVTNVLGKSTPGTFPGAHLTLATPGGSYDVSLGLFALIGEGALAVSQGQQVEITGISKTFHGKTIFLARVVRVGNNVYAVRNAHGLQVPPKSHERANQEAQDGETR